MRRVGLLLVCGAVSLVGAQEKAPWTYSQQVPGWGEMPKSMCGKTQDQSPIDIASATNQLKAEKLVKSADNKKMSLGQVSWKYEWPMVTVLLGTTPRGWQAELQSPFDTTTVLNFWGKQFFLKRMEYTSPSENHLEGKGYDMEGQFVHEAPDGQILVTSVFMEVGLVEDEVYLSTFWSKFPQSTAMPPSSQSIGNPYYGAFPSDRSFYAFNGSQTIPPCRDNTIWLVFRSPVRISRQQRDSFRIALNASSPQIDFLRYSSTEPAGAVRPWDTNLGMNNRLLQPKGNRQIFYRPQLDGESNGSPVGSSGSIKDAWVYVVLGLLVIALIAGIAALVYAMTQRRRPKAPAHDSYESDSENASQMAAMMHHQAPTPQNSSFPQAGQFQTQVQHQGSFQRAAAPGVMATQPQMHGMHYAPPGTMGTMPMGALPPTQNLNFAGGRPPVTAFNLNR
eukprot:TRINITY_DN94703_c0_g1_i1.p1 TRINITY_DN94703_c0_g1~~TRINITY_DN94703_c0_g1_i1.p1  ORF type:complete len:449 (+),score=56.99 TRINITY_DN94703_c0_g1_i1:46-1392(+)